MNTIDRGSMEIMNRNCIGTGKTYPIGWWRLWMLLSNFDPFLSLLRLPIGKLRAIIGSTIVPEVEEDFKGRTFKRSELVDMEANLL